MATVVDYDSRRSDVSALQGWERTVGRDSLLAQALSSPELPGGIIIAGTNKLVQRFLLYLLTPRGSMVYQPLMGSTFLIDSVRSRWRTPLDVHQSFYFALLDVRRQLRQDEDENDPDDERLAGAKIQSIILSPQDKVTLYVELTTMAGTTRRFLAPIGLALK